MTKNWLWDRESPTKKRGKFWQAIYEHILARLKKTGFKVRTAKIKPDPFLEKVGREIQNPAGKKFFDAKRTGR